MPREKISQFDVLVGLKDLSDEADCIAQNELQVSTGLAEYFAAIKKVVLEIRDCKNIKDIKYPPSLKSFLGEEDKKNKNVESAIPEAQKEKVHNNNNEHIAAPTETVESNTLKKKEDTSKEEVEVPVIIETKSNESKTPVSCTSKKISSVLSIFTPKMDMTFNKSVFENSLKPQELMQTPVLNRTFEKVINSDKTVVLGSGSSINSNTTSKILSIYNDSGVKTNSIKKKSLKNKVSSTGMVTRSGSKKKSLESRIDNKNKKTRSGSKKKSSKNKIVNGAIIITQLSSNKKSFEGKSENSKNIRSGSKRKSSRTKNEVNKKQKIDMHDFSLVTANKSTQPRYPLLDKNNLKSTHLISESKSKVSAVIVPSLMPKQSVVSKEKQILEEIKKKEEKANQNMKRILAERQEKTDQIKKTREEKQTRTLQKRMQLEKEKEERLEKREGEAKSQAKVKNPTKKTRTKELIEQHVKENKSLVLSAAKQSEINAEILVKTPVNRKSDEIESYELTPLQDSSTYNFSEDEDEKPTGKPIPLWAQGVLLKSALLHQHYNPIDTDELFGSHVTTPNLAEIFRVNKKRYLKRTSSAIWNHSPDRSFRC